MIIEIENTETTISTEKKLRLSIIETLGRDKIQTYQKVNSFYFFRTLFINWLLIALVFVGSSLVLKAGGIWWILFPVLSAFMATRQNALNVQVHEGSHYSNYPDRKWNDFLTNWLAGYWIAYSVDEYRKIHNLHHQFLNSAKDPDLVLYMKKFDRQTLIKGLIEDLLWITLFKRINVIRQQKKSAIDTLGKAACGIIVLSFCLLSMGMWSGSLVYFLVWILPLFSFFPMIIRLRINAEHADFSGLGASEEMEFICRSSVGPQLERFLFGAQMEFHFEHHIFPSVPYYKLIEFNADLVKSGFFDKDEYNSYLNPSYFGFWKKVFVK